MTIVSPNCLSHNTKRKWQGRISDLALPAVAASNIDLDQGIILNPNFRLKTLGRITSMAEHSGRRRTLAASFIEPHPELTDSIALWGMEAARWKRCVPRLAASLIEPQPELTDSIALWGMEAARWKRCVPRLGANATFRMLIATFLLAFAFSGASCSKRAAGKQSDTVSPKPIPARIVQVEQRQIRRNVESVGSLYPYEEVTVSSEVEGRVDQVLADVGDRVTAGQPMVKVPPAELQLTLDQQRATLNKLARDWALPKMATTSKTFAPPPKSRRPRLI